MSGHSPAVEGTYRAVFETCPEGFLLTTPDGAILDANPAASRILGRPRADLIRMSRQELVDWTDPATHAALHEWLSTGTYTGKVRWKRVDGSVFPVEVSTSLFIGLDGREQAGILFRAAPERCAAGTDPARPEVTLADALRAVGDPVFVHDDAGRLSEANEAALEIFGCSTLEEAAARSIAELLGRFVLHDTEGWDLPMARLPGFRALAGERTADLILGIRERPGAAARWLHLRAGVLTGTEAGDALAVTVGRDVTACFEGERMRAWAEVRRARLDGVVLASRELSHRLNNSLTLVVGSLDMVQDQGQLPEDAQSWIERAQLGLEIAVRDIQKFQRVKRVETKDTPAGPALDLDRSAEAI
jgi:PAS domain S-box-containing protein